MRIGIDIRAIGQQRTGDEHYTLNLVRSLLKIDNNNQYYLFTNTFKTDDIEKKIFSEIKNKNAKIIPVIPKSKLLWTFFILPKAAKQLKLDVLHVQYITPLWLSSKIKLITTVADVSFKAFPQLINKLDLFFLNIFIPLSLKKADKIIAVSKFTKNEIKRFYKIKSDKIKVIYNGGGETRIYNQKNLDKNKILNKIGIKKPYLFYIGTHQPRKDLPTLIEAFFSLKRGNYSFKNLQLVIGGKLRAHNRDPRINKIITKTKENTENKKFLKDLIFTDYLEEQDKIVLFQEAEVFVFPSLYEGFGLPLIEAMNFKVPVVCSDIDSFKEIGDGAVEFFETGNPIDLKNKLNKILGNKKEKNDLIKKGEVRKKAFSWEKTAQEFLNLIKTI
jgi:glycosyltransferase involved in cell wall biosynthesis